MDMDMGMDDLKLNGYGYNSIGSIFYPLPSLISIHIDPSLISIHIDDK